MAGNPVLKDLFDHAGEKQTQANAPLADRMRPLVLAEIVGQARIVEEGGFLAEAIREDRVPSLLLWGPPGSGKTTLGHVIAAASAAHFEPFSAVLGGVKEVRVIVEAARQRTGMHGRRTLLFVDEIHRFNKAQQDAFLPHVESGAITLIGATTENPGFTINNALLSRCRLLTFEPIGPEALMTLADRALDDDERGLGGLDLSLQPEARELLVRLSGGDGRRTLNLLEQAALWTVGRGDDVIRIEAVEEAMAGRVLRHDRGGDAHYDVTSAFIKSMRGSDPDAALYYMCRMLDAGEDPRFIFRRLLVFASEDIGNGDPRALQVAVAASQAFEVIGLPEGAIPLAQAVTYCASAPKSNASYMGLRRAQKAVREVGDAEVPLHLRNAPTAIAKGQGHGKDYVYPHDQPGGFVPGVQYLPDALKGERFYDPSGIGYERYIRERLDEWRGSPRDGSR
jgi:putative ATPase